MQIDVRINITDEVAATPAGGVGPSVAYAYSGATPEVTARARPILDALAEYGPKVVALLIHLGLLKLPAVAPQPPAG